MIEFLGSLEPLASTSHGKKSSRREKHKSNNRYKFPIYKLYGDLVTIVYLKGGQNLYMKQRNSNQQSIQRSTFWMVPSFPSPVTHHS